MRKFGVAVMFVLLWVATVDLISEATAGDRTVGQMRTMDDPGDTPPTPTPSPNL